MANYTYSCPSCKRTFEIQHGMNEESKTICPKCGKEGLKRHITGGTGVIYKCPGFYVTDYKQGFDNSDVKEAEKMIDEAEKL